MTYDMEELVPVVGNLVRKYTAGESTSVTFEKAEQLMGAVLYAIQELEQPQQAFLVSADGISAQQAYEMGMASVEGKVKKALQLYHEILPEFSHYENQCLYDTFVRGMPVFFKRYDIRWEPQNTILTLGYPVFKDISGYTGIRQIYEFLKCIDWEQKFLRLFPREEADYLRIENLLARMDQKDRNDKLQNGIRTLVGTYYENGDEISEYLWGGINGIVSSIVYACAEHTGKK